MTSQRPQRAAARRAAAGLLNAARGGTQVGDCGLFFTSDAADYLFAAPSSDSDRTDEDVMEPDGKDGEYEEELPQGLLLLA